MRSHLRIGKDLLANVPALSGVAAVVLHHHERFDRTGYPDGLAGEQIPLAAHIVCVVGASSAMISKRSYKGLLDPAAARQELLRPLARCPGQQQSVPTDDLAARL